MADGFMQIIGANGQLMDSDEGELSVIVSGLERGSLPGEMYQVGASLASSIQARRGVTPAVARFATLANKSPQLSAPRLFSPVQMAPQPQVVSSGAGAMREVTQGLDSGVVLVAAGASAVITFNTSMLFRPSRLMVPPSIAPLFTIDDLRVASDSLFLSAGAVPAENFLPDAVTASALKRRTAQPGTPVTVNITNIDSAPHRFRASIFGEAADASNCG